MLIPFRDRGFVLGDAVFDTARTFGGKIFKLGEHVERLYRSLKAIDIDPGMTPQEMQEISEEFRVRRDEFSFDLSELEQEEEDAENHVNDWIDHVWI